MRVIIALLALILSGCNSADTVRNMAPQDRLATAEQALDHLLAHEPDKLSAMLPEEIQPKLSGAYPVMIEALPKKQPVDRLLTQFNSNMATDGNPGATQFIFLLSSHGDETLAQVTVMNDPKGKAALAGIYVQKVPDPAANDLTLAGKPFINYLFVALALCAFGISVAAIVRLAIRRDVKLWPLWLVGCIFGLFQLTLNWTTSQIEFHPIAFQILSASVLQSSPISDWIVGVSSPVVAIFVIFFYRILPKKAGARRSEDAPADGLAEPLD